MIPLMIILASKLLGNVPAPDMKFDQWLPNDGFIWEQVESPPVNLVKDPTNPNSFLPNTYHVPSNVAGLLLVCNATYPVEWEFYYENWENNHRTRFQLNKLVKSKRIVGDMFTVSTFTYITELRLNGVENTLSGNYTCRSTTDPDVSTSFFIFWEGNSPPYLLHSGKNKTVYMKQDSSKNWPVITLPCHISVPDVKIAIQRKKVVVMTTKSKRMSKPTLVQTNDTKLINDVIKTNTPTSVPLLLVESKNVTVITWEDFDLSQNQIVFDPRKGYVINSPDESLVGSYKCFVGHDPTDFVFVDVMIGEAPKDPEFREMLNNNASFTYDQNTRKFTCCSDSWKPPSIQLTSCEHPTLCSLQKQNFDEVHDIGHRIPRSSCSYYTVLYESSGIIRCSGDGVAIFRDFFFAQSVGLAGIIRSNKRQARPILITGTPYYRWDDADEHNMVSISTKHQEMFDGQKVTFHCQASPYYFAEGIKWSIEWNNRSRLVQDGTENIPLIHQALFIRRGHSTIQTVVSVNMTTVTCFAPVWNSSRWFQHSLDLHVKQPQLPTIDSSPDLETSVSFIWYLNDTDKSLDCSVQGNPVPSIEWTHDNQTVNETRNANGTSTILIGLVRHSDSGIFICKAKNYAGESTKIFHVTVIERTSAGFVVGITFACLLTISALIALGFLGMRLNKQATAISHLKNVAFKDVTDHNQHHNQGQDYGFNGISSIISPSVNGVGIVHETITGAHLNNHNNNNHHFSSAELQAPDIDETEQARDVLEETESPPSKLINYTLSGGYHKF